MLNQCPDTRTNPCLVKNTRNIITVIEESFKKESDINFIDIFIIAKEKAK